MSKSAYERLARTPGVTPLKVARLSESGRSLAQIQRQFGMPRGRPALDPFVTPSCPDYPESLRTIDDPPLRLFHQGLPPASLGPLIVGVVGSRKASSFGLSWARRLGASLARRGVTVCSGLARGIDGAVHRGVLEEMGRNPKAGPPLGVLGHGWGMYYPRSNAMLAQQVSQHGVLLTEYDRGTAPTRWSFPARNRIIAGLSKHLVVVEAGARSGSLYTADFALRAGRSVWIVPNAPGRPNSAGVLSLWKDGADIITDLEEFVETVAPLRRSSGNPTLPRISEENKELLATLARVQGEAGNVLDELSLTPTELAYRLTELELDGLVRRGPEGRWELIDWELVSHLR